MVQELLNEIENSCYWDSRVKALNCNYFGNEVEIVFEDDERDVTYHFEECYKVKIEHAMEYPKEIASKDLTRPQIPYFMQDVELEEIEIDNKEYIKTKANMYPTKVLIVYKKFNIYIIRRKLCAAAA